jgi:hypothetical protein
VPTLGSIRVLLALDGLAADLLERRLEADEQFELVGRCSSPGRVLDAAMQTSPDFVVVPTPAAIEAPGTFDFFASADRVKVLTLETTGGRAFLTELIGDVSPDELATALRRAAEREEL